MGRPGTPGHKQIGRHDASGCTVTVARRSDPTETLSIARSGVSRITALRECLAALDPAEYRVLTISTPQSIYDDLSGSRVLQKPGESYFGRGTRDLAKSIGGVTGPERQALGRAKLSAFL